MIKQLSILLIASMLVLSGCRSELYTSPEAIVDEDAFLRSGIYRAEQFSLFREERLTLARFEPPSGTYLGAYIRSDTIVAGNIELFEQMVGREHSFYTYFLKLGQRLPTEWVLECIAHVRTPNIILEPNNIATPFNKHLLRYTARSFGDISVPMFVHFYPVSHSASYNTEDYLTFFRAARTYFERYAPNVAFVWVIDADSFHLMDAMYPGDDYVDWVGINLFVDSQATICDVRLRIDSFYFNFQERKPIFISQLGISHFSAHDHTHRVRESSEMMLGIFLAIERYYPRIKAVNYMSINSIDPVRNRGGMHNFSLTDNEHITRAYAEVVDNPHFLTRVNFNPGGNEISQRLSHPNPVRYYRGDFFVRSHMDIGGGTRNLNIAPSAVVEMDNIRYYPLSTTVEGSGAIRVNFDLQTVEIVSFR